MYVCFRKTRCQRTVVRVIRAAALTAFCCLLWTVASAAAVEVSGRVFLDRNQNGRFDETDSPVSDCLVSDGVQLVRSDAHGRYRLRSVDAPTDVFVVNLPGTWPSGPWWSYVDESVDKNVIDFALRCAEQPEPFYFVQGTDMHIRPDAMSQYRQYIQHVNQLSVPLAFVVHTGDLVIDALRAMPRQAEPLFNLYDESTAGLKMPVRNMIGNHGHVAIALKNKALNSDIGKGMYRRRFGPTSYAFRYGDYHFIALDGTTLDPSAANGYRDGLDNASAQWAARYLQTVEDAEPIILLVHQPLGRNPAARRLLEALRGKRLLLTLWGHGHSRSVSTFGGAPAVMGGAVSYAWHGLIPYPPDPWGYVLLRVENGEVTYAFRDWAHRRSLGLTRPAWGQPASGQLALRGTVSDLDGTLQRLVCQVAQSSADVEFTSADPLEKEFRAELDVAGLPDGVYDMVFTLEDQEGVEKQSRPLLVLNGKTQPCEAAQPATLKMRLTSPPRLETEVVVNDQVVGSLSAAGKSQEVSFELEPSVLQRLNYIAFQVHDGDRLELSNLRVELDGSVRRDVRFSLRRRLEVTSAHNQKASKSFYIDVLYDGPRGR